MKTCSLPSIDDLDRSIVSLATRINAATHELLVLVRQFDERAGWLKWGFDHCADWLHRRCDVSMNAAREKVRAAHALKYLPDTSRAFSNGTLSYSKVRAITRVAGPDNEPSLVEFARRNSTAQLEERCREMRCGTIASTADANRAFASRSVTIRRNPDRGTMTLTAELPLETGEMIGRALDKARDASVPLEFGNECWAARQADAFVAVMRVYLSGGAEKATSHSGNYLVNLHVDKAALEGKEGTAGLPIESVRRIACDADTVLIVDDEHGNLLSVGRKSRSVPKAIKRAVQARDKCCRFPGCRNKRFVDTHHVRHWAAGGETSLDNLLSLCSRHHRLVHEGGYRIDKDFRDRWVFRRPDGIAVPDCGYQAADRIDDLAESRINDLERTPAGGLLTRLE